MKGKTEFALIFFLIVVSLSATVYAGTSAYWRGFVLITNSTGNNMTASSGTVVDVFINGVWRPQNTTTGSQGSLGSAYYIAEVVGDVGDNVTFRVWGSATDNTTPIAWTPGWHTGEGPFQWFNLTFTTKAAGAACNNSNACSGGYCCSGGTTILMAGPYSGTAGTCQATACASSSSSSSSSSSGSSSGGGGGGAATSTSESATASGTVSSGSVATFSLTKAADIGISEIAVTTANAVTNAQVTVSTTTIASSQAPAISSASSQSVYTYLSITKTNIKDADIKTAKVKFQIPKKWVTDNKIDYTKVVLTRFTNEKWVDQKTTFLKEDATNYFFEAEVPGFSLFAIKADKITTVTAFDVIDTIRAFYAGTSSKTAFEIIDMIRNFYAQGG